MKEPRDGGLYRRKKGHEDCIAALTIHGRLEYVAARAQGEVFSHVCTTKEFLDEFEESPFDLTKVHAMLLRRMARQGATERARQLLANLDPARIPPTEGDVEMSATKKAAAKPAASGKKAPAPKVEAKKVDAKKAAAPAKGKTKVEAAPEGGRGRKAAFSKDGVIKLLVKENPKRAGAAVRFGLYADGMTVDQYVAKGGTMADVRWDVRQNYISVK